VIIELRKQPSETRICVNNDCPHNGKEQNSTIDFDLKTGRTKRRLKTCKTCNKINPEQRGRKRGK
jgi:hypothetical protein